jgi:hypothetical protein
VSDDTPADLDALVADMRGPFLRSARERVALIARLGSDLAIASDPRQPLARLIREAHTLRGGGSVFGFHSLSDAGGRVESAGKRALDHPPSSSPSLEPLYEAIAELEAVIAGLSGC